MKKTILGTYIALAVLFVVFLFLKIPEMKSIDYDLSRFGIENDFPVKYNQGELQLADAQGMTGFFLSSHLIVLPAGNYRFDITYYSDEPNKVHFQANNDVFVEYELASGQNTVSIPITLLTQTANGKLRFTYYGAGEFDIQKITCSSDKILYSDLIFYIFLFVFSNVIIFFIYINRVNWNITSEKIKTIIFLLVMSVLSIPVIALFHNGLYLATDMVGHLFRIESIKDGLLEMQFPVVIYPNMCNEYGSIGTAYPSTFLYFPAFLRILNISPVCVYKFCTLLINFMLNFAVFYSTKFFSGSNKMPFFATIIFDFSIFHLDMVGYKNWTMGMGIATIFMLAAIIGLYDILFENQERWYLLTIGMTGIINSHIMTTVLTGILIFVVCLIFFRKMLAKRRRIAFLKAVVFSIGINICTLYLFFDALSNNLNTQRLQWTSFGEDTYSLFDIVTKPINLWTVLCLVIVFVYLMICRKSQDSFYIFTRALFGIDVVVFLLTTNIFPWDRLLKIQWVNLIVSYIQFPNRLYVILTPTLAIMTAICFYKNSGIFIKCRCFIISFFILLSLWSYACICNEYRDGMIAIADSILGDVFSTHASDDYLPNGADYKWYSNPYPALSDYDGSITITNYTKFGTRIQGEYTCTKENQYMDLPLFFYKGYRCIDIDGNPIEITKGENAKIRLQLSKTDEPKSFIIFYSVPKIYKILFAFSAMCTIFFVMVQVRYVKFFAKKKDKTADFDNYI